MLETSATRPRGPLLEEVLLGYLQSNHAFPWPGTDGLTLADVLDSYRLAVARGWVPDRKELCRRHPELRDELAIFF